MGDYAKGMMNTIQIEVEKRMAYLHLLQEFEKKHHEFLNSDEAGYFVNEIDGAVVFFPERRQGLRDYFGQGWTLCNGAVEKTVDGIVLRLLPDNGAHTPEDVDI